MLRFGPVIREKCTCGMPDNLGPIFLLVATSSMNSDQVGFLLSSRMYQRCGATNVRVRSSHFCAMCCRVPCGCQFFQHVVRVQVQNAVPRPIVCLAAACLEKNCANIGPNTSKNPSQSDLKLKNIERQLQKIYRCTPNGLCSKGVINFERTWLHFRGPRPSKF